MIHYSTKIINAFIACALCGLALAFCVTPVKTQGPLVRSFAQPCISGLAGQREVRFRPQVLPEFVEGGHYALVRRLAAQYGVDYRLVLAIIKQESQFHEDALSEQGATGLMQIMPVTNAELFDQLELREDDIPRENLRAGTYYFSKLMDLFASSPDEDRICLALAAYNAGPARVYDAQKLAAYIGENPQRWSSIRNVLPLLSKRYYSLHQEIWNSGKPRNGFFGSSRQTIDYVESVLKSYRTFQQHA